MFEIGQHVIHPGQGVCTVTGFTEDVAHPMILLRAKSGHAETHHVSPPCPAEPPPCNHPARGRRRPHRLLRRPTVDSFTERNSALEETHFKQQLKLGAPETVRVAKTMQSPHRRGGSPWKETEQLRSPHAQGGAPPHARRALRRPRSRRRRCRRAIQGSHHPSGRNSYTPFIYAPPQFRDIPQFRRGIEVQHNGKARTPSCYSVV